MKKSVNARVQAFAEQAYLAVIFIQQGDVSHFNSIMEDMGNVIEEDKKLAQNLLPGVERLCQERGLELHGGHLTKTEKH